MAHSISALEASCDADRRPAGSLAGRYQDLVDADRRYLIHPLHHPVDNANPIVYARGRGAIVEDVEGRHYLDGLSGLWNVNIGHGRRELADAAASQMTELAYCSGFVGSSNVPSITLAERLVALTG